MNKKKVISVATIFLFCLISNFVFMTKDAVAGSEENANDWDNKTITFSIIEPKEHTSKSNIANNNMVKNLLPNTNTKTESKLIGLGLLFIISFVLIAKHKEGHKDE